MYCVFHFIMQTFATGDTAGVDPLAALNWICWFQRVFCDSYQADGKPWAMNQKELSEAREAFFKEGSEKTGM
jgi:hypothetical protein